MVEETKGRTITPEYMEGIVDGLVGGGTIGSDVGDDIKKIFHYENNVGKALGIADETLDNASETLKKLKNAYNLHV